MHAIILESTRKNSRETEMYLFSAIKDALFSRRPSLGETDETYGERPKRRSISEAYLPADSPEASDRDVPVGHKAKRMDSDVPIRDYETKRRRTTFGLESKPKLSIDREDVGRFTSGSRLPSPLPRHSMPGPRGSRRDSILGSPSVAPLSRGSSPRASPLTPSHPRFVDLLRRDPSQQRALDSARSILDTLDRVTSVSGGIGAPGSGRKYRPPQPLRPMRFKSLTSATRPVSLYDMLSGATTPAAVPASPQAPAIRAPTGKSQEPSPLAKPIPVMTTTTLTAFPGSPRPVGPGSPLISRPPAESPKKTFLVPTKLPSPVHKPVAEPQTVVTSIFDKKPEQPKKEVVLPPAEPPKGGFIWGDPTKVSDADFIEDDGFAPGADDSSSSESEDEKPPAQTIPSIFGGSSTSIFGTSTAAQQPVTGSIFGTSTEPKSIFGSAPSPKSAADSKPNISIFGSAPSPKSAGTSSEVKSIFGGITASSPKSSTQPSIFGTTSTEVKTQSIFGEPKTEVSSIFGGAPTKPLSSATEQPTTSIFGSSSATGPSSGASIFGASTTSSMFGAPASDTTAVSSIFGSSSAPAHLEKEKPAETEKPVSSLFGGQTSAAAPSSSSTAGGMFVFGATPPASPGAGSAPAHTGTTSIFGSTTTQPTATSTSIFGQSQQQQPPSSSNGSSLFGTTAPSQPSMFGSLEPTAAPSGASIFGSTAPSGSSLFGSTSSAVAPASPFGAPPAANSSSIFGSAPTPSANNLFGAQPSSNTSIFGSAPTPSDNVFGSTGIAPASPFGVPTGGIFGAPSPAPTPGGDNPFAASSEDFKSGAPKRKILKAARRG